jgi:hypothetical protein
MRRLSRHTPRLAVAMALLGFAGSGSASAQDNDDDLVEVRVEQRDRMGFGIAGRIVISDRNIDAWIYGNESRGRDWLETSLKQRVDEVGKVCRLSDSQVEKLNLAGKGDIQRFEGRVAELKAHCQTGAIQPRDWNEIFQKTQPLRLQLQRGLFGSGSLFHKTLLTTLRPEQMTHYGQIDRERRVFRYRARVELCVAQLDAVTGLSDQQRRRLVQLILDNTRPPKSFGQFGNYVVLVQMSRLPEETLKSLFLASQWREIHRRLVQAQQMMPTLKQSGVIFDEDEAEPDKQTEEAERDLRGGLPAVRVERLRN